MEEWLPALAAATGDLEMALGQDRLPGARLERKRCATVLHTRGLDSPGADAEAMRLVGEVARTYGLAVTAGKRAAEVRVPVARDKGSAAADIRAAGWETSALCAAGDDGGDVPMLRVALYYHGHTVTAPVIDRGPYVAGREYDLTGATKARLHFGSTGTVWSSPRSG